MFPGFSLAGWGLRLQQGKKQQMSSAPPSDLVSLKNRRKQPWDVLISANPLRPGRGLGGKSLWMPLDYTLWPSSTFQMSPFSFLKNREA